VDPYLRQAAAAIDIQDELIDVRPVEIDAALQFRLQQLLLLLGKTIRVTEFETLPPSGELIGVTPKEDGHRLIRVAVIVLARHHEPCEELNSRAIGFDPDASRKFFRDVRSSERVEVMDVSSLLGIKLDKFRLLAGMGRLGGQFVLLLLIGSVGRAALPA